MKSLKICWFLLVFEVWWPSGCAKGGLGGSYGLLAALWKLSGGNFGCFWEVWGLKGPLLGDLWVPLGALRALLGET